MLGSEKRAEQVLEQGADEQQLLIDINLVKPNPMQPRKSFNKETLLELSESIKNQGLLVPILVERDSSNNSSYKIIAGERRWRASKLAGKKKNKSHNLKAN